MARSGMSVFLALWRAYGEGRLERSLELVDPSCELVALDGDSPYRGHDGVRACLADARRWRTLTVTFDAVDEPHDGCVVAAGRVVGGSSDRSPALDRPFVCVMEFRDGRLAHGRAFAGRAEALEFVAQRASRLAARPSEA
ncbi:MAG: hypothetical protein QOD44_401 [Solirubrobacteraceae bacterium]|jgi:ketosteroid isomerase-like protein|nr:hypothetical protein [Solirubrobacteraceae bacterium]